MNVRKVKVLEGTAKEEAENLKLNPEDLVLVKDSHIIDKIDGDPVSFLLKRAGKE
jgi:hypothetical protein